MDSPLEGTGFEPSVPLLRRLFWALPIGDGGTRGGATYRFRSETAMLAWCSKQCQCEAEAGACRRSPPTGLVARADGRASDQNAARATTKSNACSESTKAGSPCSFTRSGHSSFSGAPEVIIEA